MEESRKEKKKVVAVSKSNTFFIGDSVAIKKAYALAEKVAKTDATVLILGENGTGKLVMANYIHNKSGRNQQPFVHVDLGALNNAIFESELFGYAQGAFTDAKTDTPGRFELAQNGTIFLDEIGNVPLHLQVKLLQVLQNKSVTRLGESKPRQLNVRILAATNVNLQQEVTLKNFREDLYYRINTMEIVLPPLRERKEDILLLAQFLLNNMIEKYNRDTISFSDDALEQLQKHNWNGNIREMENRIERAVILCENNIITSVDLDLTNIITPSVQSIEDKPLSDMEKQTIEKVLRKNNFNISKSAEELGLSRAALYRRMEKFDLKN